MDDAIGDRRPDRPHVADERGNPFVTFSRLVDQQASSFFRTFVRVSSSFARPSSDRVEPVEQGRKCIEAREEAEHLETSFNELFTSRSKKMRGKEERSFDDYSIPHSKKKPSYWGIDFLRRAEEPEKQHEPFARVEESIASWNQQRLYEEIRKKSRNIHEEYEEVEKVMDCIRSRLCELYSGQESRCPYRPVDENFDDVYRKSPVELILPSSHLVIPKSCSTQYVTKSPYPPLDLETRDPFREYRLKWGKAFEDLLLVSNGQSLSEDRFQDGRTDKWDWINLLAKDDLIGYNTLTMRMASTDQGSQWVTRVPENDARADASTTELDLYERFLGSQSLESASSAIKQSLPSNTKDQANSDKPNLISTLTTTERRTLPDGGVYTQMVLRKRFSDGMEESTETEHTTHSTQHPTPGKYTSQVVQEAPQASTLSLGHDGKTKQALGQRIEEQRQRGWFWS
ncbi:MAG: hypothetical protein LQ346_004878 [Caloplaca aetnensis]|nr:MAG: hypothetical protein LQ346_004878 [Caloplaca aetnensis]